VPLTTTLMPCNDSIENDKAILQILKHYHINPQQQQHQNDSTISWTIIDIDLPSESILYANLDITFTPLRHDKRGFNRYKMRWQSSYQPTCKTISPCTIQPWGMYRMLPCPCTMPWFLVVCYQMRYNPKRKNLNLKNLVKLW
jgi:hypothetical protein